MDDSDSPRESSGSSDPGPIAATAIRRAPPNPLTHEQATSLVESWLRFRVQETTVDLLRNALSSKERWNLSYWDAAVVEGARLAGCRVLLTEDLQHGADFAGVRVENPFR